MCNADLKRAFFFFCWFRFSDTQECLLPLKMFIKSRSEPLWRTRWRRQSTEVNLINKFITLSAALWQDRAAPSWYVELEASSEKIMSREEQDEIYFSFHHDCNKLIACLSHWTHWTRREAKRELSRETAENCGSVTAPRAHKLVDSVHTRQLFNVFTLWVHHVHIFNPIDGLSSTSFISLLHSVRTERARYVSQWAHARAPQQSIFLAHEQISRQKRERPFEHESQPFNISSKREKKVRYRTWCKGMKGDKSVNFNSDYKF